MVNKSNDFCTTFLNLRSHSCEIYVCVQICVFYECGIKEGCIFHSTEYYLHDVHNENNVKRKKKMLLLNKSSFTFEESC